tara:strand:- start:2867 stop:3598 length:732 start_codon:yes stop_codon:yes gene_type:complete
MAIQSASGNYGVSARADGSDIKGGLKNDGATILNGGNADVTDELGQPQPVTVVKRLDQMAKHPEHFYGGRVVMQSGINGADPQIGVATAVGFSAGQEATGSGTLAFNPDPADRTASDPQFIIRGVATTINNTSNTTLQSRGSTYRVSDGSAAEKAVTTSVQQGAYASAEIDVLAQPATGTHPERTKGAGAGTAYNLNTASGSYGTGLSEDVRVGRSFGGGINFMQGGAVSSGTDYKPRDTYES